MPNKIIFIFFFFQTLILNGQTKKIESNIKKLNNNEFYIDHTKKASFSIKSSSAHKLIAIGKPATEKLIEALSDSTKVIMAHLVLCHIYLKLASFAGPKEQMKNDVTVYKYYLGEEKGEGLIISKIKTTSGYNIYVEPKDREKIISYWKNKISKN
jgi:hypothetical protein